MTPLSARQIIERLGMQRHPEGDWYAQTFEDGQDHDGRARSTAIYYLLEAGERSHWHRVDAAEVWHFYAGAPLKLGIAPKGAARTDIVLGPDILAGQRPQGVVPPHAWQAAESTGEWTLVGCTVAPGFRFSGFELAPPGWEPAP